MRRRPPRWNKARVERQSGTRQMQDKVAEPWARACVCVCVYVRVRVSSRLDMRPGPRYLASYGTTRTPPPPKSVLVRKDTSARDLGSADGGGGAQTIHSFDEQAGERCKHQTFQKESDRYLLTVGRLGFGWNLQPSNPLLECQPASQPASHVRSVVGQVGWLGPQYSIRQIDRTYGRRFFGDGSASNSNRLSCASTIRISSNAQK
jgi:hypothetical protein